MLAHADAAGVCDGSACFQALLVVAANVVLGI
jgi:hypothetical protein